MYPIIRGTWDLGNSNYSIVQLLGKYMIIRYLDPKGFGRRDYRVKGFWAILSLRIMIEAVTLLSVGCQEYQGLRFLQVGRDITA